MIAAESRNAILDLLTSAAQLLDEGKLEEWVDCFTEEAMYCILSRENVDRSLPLPLLKAETKDMLRDRIMSLRTVNIVNIHHDRHIVGPPRITAAADGLYQAKSSYAMYQTDPDGISKLFSVGAYVDRISVEAGVARFTERTVLVDTFSIPTMLSTPI